MTVNFPDGVDAQGNASLWFLPAIADPSAPTLAEFAAGVNLSCAIDGFSAPSEQGSSQDIRYCSKQNFENPGRVTTTIDPIAYVYDPQDPTNNTEYKHYNVLKAGVKGYLVNRLGVDVNTAIAATDVVDVYPVTAGNQSRQAIDPSAEGSKIKILQKFFVTGPVAYDAVVAAGA
jgi:hypothetical protein